MKKDIFSEERKLYRIQIIESHHKGTGKVVIMTRRKLGTKLGIDQSTKVRDTQKGGNLGTK